MLTEEERRRMIANAAALENAGISEDEARQAIDGYLQAALFTATDEEGRSLEGLGLAWSSEAQIEARNAVIDFITGAPHSCGHFAAQFGTEGWLQVGIDFCFTRNGEGAGFWSRSGIPDDIKTTLTENAKEWGERNVVIDDNGELGFA